MAFVLIAQPAFITVRSILGILGILGFIVIIQFNRIDLTLSVPLNGRTGVGDGRVDILAYLPHTPANGIMLKVIANAHKNGKRE